MHTTTIVAECAWPVIVTRCSPPCSLLLLLPRSLFFSDCTNYVKPGGCNRKLYCSFAHGKYELRLHNNTNLMLGGPGNIFGVVPPQPGVTREDVERNGRDRERDMQMQQMQQQQQQQQPQGPSATLTIQGGSQVLPRELVASLQASGINISAPLGEQQSSASSASTQQQQQQQQPPFHHHPHRNSTGLLGLGPIPSLGVETRHGGSFSSSTPTVPSSNAALNKKFQQSQVSYAGGVPGASERVGGAIGANGLAVSPRPTAHSFGDRMATATNDLAVKNELALGQAAGQTQSGFGGHALVPSASSAAAAAATAAAADGKELGREFDRLRENAGSPGPDLSPAYAALGLGPAASAAAAALSAEEQSDRESFRESTDHLKIRILDLVDEVAAAHYQRAMDDQAVAMANGQTFKAMSATLHSTGVCLQATKNALAIYTGEEAAIASLQVPALDALTSQLQAILASIATAKAKLESSPSPSSAAAVAAAGGASPPSAASSVCGTCQSDPIATVVWPCGHRVLCGGCRPEVCPSCQVAIQKILPLQSELPNVSALISATPSAAGSPPSRSPSGTRTPSAASSPALTGERKPTPPATMPTASPPLTNLA